MANEKNVTIIGLTPLRTNNALVQSFGVNSLNELTGTTNGGRLTVAGVTSPTATSVTVNGSNAILYADSTYAATNMPLTSVYTAVASNSTFSAQSTATVSVNLPTSVAYQYDANGNLTNDGLRTFVYDAENQLIRVTGTKGIIPWKSDFTYDGKMRRRIRTEANYILNAWITNSVVRYVYDGNLVIQERDGNNAALVTYTRGKDLSGGLEGAGGIGGLLARTDNSLLAVGDTNAQAFYHSDGNGNVTVLANSAQTAVAKYLYDAFGNTLAKSGTLADANLYRFSSKEFHQNSGLVYYLYRYYDPNLQRWPNRDPLFEDGGLNLYGYVNNDPLSEIDPFGLYSGWKNGFIESNLQDAAKKCGGKLSDKAAKALRKEMTDAELDKLSDDKTSEAEKAATLQAIADRVQKDPKVDDDTKKNIKDAGDACKPKPCPPKPSEGGPPKTNEGGKN